MTVYIRREWLKARKDGDYSATTYDMAMEGFLIQTCGLLYQLERAKPTVRSFISSPRVTLANLNLLPAEMLASMPEYNRDQLRKATVAQAMPEKNIEVTTAQELELSYGGLQQWFSEAERADFNGDESRIFLS